MSTGRGINWAAGAPARCCTAMCGNPGGSRPSPLAAARASGRDAWVYQFVPLPYQPDNNGIPVQHAPSGYDQLRTIAVSRLFLDNFDHITAYWVGMGLAWRRSPSATVPTTFMARSWRNTSSHMAGASRRSSRPNGTW